MGYRPDALIELDPGLISAEHISQGFHDFPQRDVLLSRVQDGRAFCSSCRGRGPNDYVCTKCNELITGAEISALGIFRALLLRG